ncbi:MAG: hypothetical protein Q7S79_01210 [bacterium]|nr:hypothetical protein [bacterium]
MRYTKKHWVEILVATSGFAFSCWLFWHTFFVQGGNIVMGSKVWSDFGSHIPLIRSFSLGANFPNVEFPLFPGEPIRYHYLFYLVVGSLEKIGVRIDIALNTLSAIGFSALLYLIYALGKVLFKSRAVGVISVILFLFNSSLSFLEYFSKGGTLGGIVGTIDFPSFGPYREGEIVSAFWNLNIYTNQRHFALASAVLLGLVLWIIMGRHNTRRSLVYCALWGIGVGLLPFLHSSIFVTTYAVLGVMFLLFREYRKQIFVILLIGFLVALPRTLFLQHGATFTPELVFGYLSKTQGFNFFEYWFFNMGASLFLIPVGFIVAPARAKKVFLAFFALFILGNTIQFSQEMAGNHKFFNIFLIVGNMFTAYALLRIWKKSYLGKILLPTLLLALTFSGAIDFFAIKNDPKYTLVDIPNNRDATWILENTPKDSVFLNTSYLYHGANIAGRKVYLGWPYFAMSLGHDTLGRYEKQKEVLASVDKDYVCGFLKENHVDYVALDDPKEEIVYDLVYWEDNFVKLYSNPETSMHIFGRKESCLDKTY